MSTPTTPQLTEKPTPNAPPQPTPLPPTAHDCTSVNLRRLLHIGKSLAITLPPAWYQSWLDTSNPFVTTSVTANGILQLHPSPPHLQPQNYA